MRPSPRSIARPRSIAIIAPPPRRAGLGCGRRGRCHRQRVGGMVGRLVRSADSIAPTIRAPAACRPARSRRRPPSLGRRVRRVLDGGESARGQRGAAGLADGEDAARVGPTNRSSSATAGGACSAISTPPGVDRGRRSAGGRRRRLDHAGRDRPDVEPSTSHHAEPGRRGAGVNSKQVHAGAVYRPTRTRPRTSASQPPTGPPTSNDPITNHSRRHDGV